MSSETKPKVICKNLEDIIKESMFSTKRNSVEDSQKRQSSQRILKSEPRQRRSTERCNTSVSRGNKLYESGKRLNTSISKHSLESKEKIKILEAKISTNTSACKLIEQKNTKHAVVPTSAVQFYPLSTNKNAKNNKSSSIPSKTHFKSLYFNQVDAILTQLQDFIRETREKICLEMDFMNEENLADMLANQLTQLTNVFKNELEGLIDRSLYIETDNEVLKPKNRVEMNQNQTLKLPSRQYSSQKNPRGQFQDQLIKIQQFMQRQTTSPSTINSQPFQQSLPTQTDAQILSMLVYKNKLHNTKRKIQSTDTYGQELMSPWVKSGRSTKDGEGEYSFRNKGGSREKESNGSIREVDMKRKKNIGQDKSANKENKEKSIYQMVLEENRRAKGDWRR